MDRFNLCEAAMMEMYSSGLMTSDYSKPDSDKKDNPSGIHEHKHVCSHMVIMKVRTTPGLPALFPPPPREGILGFHPGKVCAVSTTEAEKLGSHQAFATIRGADAVIASTSPWKIISR